MRKVVAGAFLSLDGVMQAPGGPEEDPTGGFPFGGWTAPYWDEALGAAMGEVFGRPFDLLLGRRTYDIFAAHWPLVASDPTTTSFDALTHQVAVTFNKATKYVATHRPATLRWENSTALGPHVAASVKKLREGDGPTLLIQGSSELVHQLLAADLIDELQLLTYPVILGKGKRFFASDGAPRSLTVKRTISASNGVILANYERGGAVKVGSFAMAEPSAAELERRKTWT